jgi:GNAT superfamily N-acetyltransferase
MTDTYNYYFTKNNECYRLYKEDLCIAICSFVFYKERSDAVYISDLYVENEYRHRGIGTRLLYEFLFDVYSHNGTRYAFLVDATDRYRHTDNIYTKMGFTYKQMADDNDMVGNLRHILFGRNYIKNI